MPDQLSNTGNSEMSFLEHLEALRWHLVRSIVVIMAVAIVLFFFHEFIFGAIIFGPKNPDFITYRVFCKLSHLLNLGDSLCIKEISFSLINTDLSGQFTMHIWISFTGGAILAFPYVLWELWRFIRPALHEKERKSANSFVFFASFLFLSGVLFSYYVIVPLSVNFLGTYQVSAEVVNMISMDSYISSVSTLTLATGIIFELPIIVYFLTRFGILSPEFMKRYRKHAVVIILVVAAVITPSSDVTTQLVVAVPLYFLYEISIFVSKYVMKQQKV